LLLKQKVEWIWISETEEKDLDHERI
jgi:hypothetical protein